MIVFRVDPAAAAAKAPVLPQTNTGKHARSLHVGKHGGGCCGAGENGLRHSDLKWFGKHVLLT